MAVLHALVSLNSPQFFSAYCVCPVPLSTSFVGMDSLGHSSKPSTISLRWPLHMCCPSHNSEHLAARTSHLRGAPLCAEALGRSPQHTATLMLLCPSAAPSAHPPLLPKCPCMQQFHALPSALWLCTFNGCIHPAVHSLPVQHTSSLRRKARGVNFPLLSSKLTLSNQLTGISPSS